MELTHENYRTALAAARSEGETAGRVAATERVKAILESDSAKGRETLARFLAFESEVSVEQSVVAMEKVPRARKVELVRCDPETQPGNTAEPKPTG
jgi:hypothetical protein